METFAARRLPHFLCIALFAATLALPAFAVAQSVPPQRVRVVTSMGEFVIQLEADRAPLTVANFLGYVKAGHYSNTLFHRVIANFVIQGGGVSPDYKLKPANKPIPNEAGNGLKNLRGTVGLARAAGAHSGDAQFYVNIADNADLDPLPTRWGYAVFGRIVEGMEVVDRIASVATGPAGPLKADAPFKQVIIQKAELLASAAGTATAPAATSAPTPPAAPAASPPADQSAPPTPR
jgi:peptidyl-prolyl cis-trans isomerase A (cyclophilin A)